MSASAPSNSIGPWLRSLGLAKYEPLFAQHAIDFDLLPEVVEGDLKELAIPLGDRKRLLAAIARLRGETRAPGPVPESRDGAEAAVPGRRQMTIMFCDLVGSTQLATELDPEDMAEVLRAYRNCCAEVIARWSGYVASYLGDGIIAYFGWPHAHEDDAERAVGAGLELTAAIGRLRVGADGAELAARVGIAAGLVMVGEVIGDDYAQGETVVGAVLNLAARLQTVAGAGQVVIPNSTYQLIGGRFDCIGLGALRLKGFPDEIEVWQVNRLATLTRFNARVAQRLTPLVGRARERQVLIDLWRRSEQGEGGAVLVIGEAGLGKSRLARALVETLRGSPHVIQHWQCSSLHSNSVLYPFIERFNRLAGISAEDGPETKLQKAQALLVERHETLDNEIDALAAILALPLGGVQPPAMGNLPHQQIVDAVTSVIRNSARDQPLLLTVEDIHWADATTMDVLKRLADDVGSEQIMLLMTSRLDAGLDWAADRRVETIKLRRLGRTTAARMVREIAGGKALPQKTLDVIVSTADGIPLFIEELTRTVLESGGIKSAVGFGLGKADAGLAIPATLRDLLAARLDRLSVDKEIAQVAATIGRTFSLRLVAHVLQRSETALKDAFLHLCDAGILERRGAGADRRYVFRHALIQEAAYQSQLNARRREVHWRIARAIETHFPEEARAFPEAMARHFAEAGLPEPAAQYELEAGRKALRLSASSEAIAHLRKGLDLVARVPSGANNRLILRLNASLGTAFMIAKGWASPEADDVYRAATALIHAAADPAEAIWILWARCVQQMVRGNLAEATAVRDRTRTLADAQQEARPRLIVDMMSLQIAFYSGRFEEAAHYCVATDTGFAAADGESLTGLYTMDLRLVSIVHRALASCICGAVDDARTQLKEAERLARAVGHPHTLAWTLTWGSTVYLFCRDLKMLAVWVDEGFALAVDHGFRYVAAEAEFMRGWLRAQEGDRDLAISEMQRGLANFEATGASIAVPHFRTLIAETLVAAGRNGEALDLLAEARAQAEGLGEAWQLAEIYRVTGEALAASSGGDMRGADEAFLRALAIAESQGARMWLQRAQASRAGPIEGDWKHDAGATGLPSVTAVCTPAAEAGE
jgi:class 3 adenylate cyclase/predicted ATPase/DNA-binding Lrp family transcriptional regulator